LRYTEVQLKSMLCSALFFSSTAAAANSAILCLGFRAEEVGVWAGGLLDGAAMDKVSPLKFSSKIQPRVLAYRESLVAWDPIRRWRKECWASIALRAGYQSYGSSVLYTTRAGLVRYHPGISPAPQVALKLETNNNFKMNTSSFLSIK
jgi:hypothetical protein